MADPLRCLRNSTIGIAIWNVIYSLIQMGIMGWQTKEVKNIQWEYENRQLPATGAADGFQARFPGLYAIYTETPERRRINAMYVIVLVCIFLAIVHFFSSLCLLYGAIKYHKNWIFPWFFTAFPIVIMSTAYAVLWWSGDVFNEQLTMSVAEFVMSLAINGICIILVLWFYARLAGCVTSDKPAQEPRSHRHSHRHRQLPYVIESSNPQAPLQVVISQNKRECGQDRRRQVAKEQPWRTEWPELPDPQLQRKLRQKRRSQSPRVSGIRRKEDNALDFYAPEAYDKGFPWKMEKIKRGQLDERRPTQAETIEKLYYKNNPEEVPDIPHGMRSSLRKEKRRGRSPERVSFSRNDPSVHMRTPSNATPERQSTI